MTIPASVTPDLKSELPWQCTDIQSIERNNIMGLGDKMKNAAENVSGKAKEATGKATDNERLEAEGKGDQAKAKVKDAAEDAKDKLTGH